MLAQVVIGAIIAATVSLFLYGIYSLWSNSQENKHAEIMFCMENLVSEEERKPEARKICEWGDN